MSIINVLKMCYGGIKVIFEQGFGDEFILSLLVFAAFIVLIWVSKKIAK